MMVTDLGYGDAFCLVSATPDGLQRIIALCCDAVGMLPSSDKTVVVEMTGWQSAGGSWSCGGRALRQVSEARYLGAIFQSGHRWHACSIGHRQLGLNSRGIVRRECG